MAIESSLFNFIDLEWHWCVTGTFCLFISGRSSSSFMPWPPSAVKNFIGILDLYKHLLGLHWLVRVVVWMPYFYQLSVSKSDVLWSCLLTQRQHLECNHGTVHGANIIIRCVKGQTTGSITTGSSTTYCSLLKKGTSLVFFLQYTWYSGVVYVECRYTQ